MKHTFLKRTLYLVFNYKVSKKRNVTIGDEDKLEDHEDIKPIIKQGKILTDNVCHTSLLISKPRHFKFGDNFYQFCDRFIEYVRINDIYRNLDLIFLSLVDDRTRASLKCVPLKNEDKLCPESLCKAFRAAFNPNIGNGAMIAQIYTIKQDHCESIDDFCYRLGNIAQKMDMPEKELDFHKLEAFIKGIKDNAIRVEIARDKKNLSYGKAVIAAKQLEAFFSTDGTENGYANKLEKVHDNRKFQNKKRNKYRSDHFRSYTQNYSFRKKDRSSRNASLGANKDGQRHRNNYLDVNKKNCRSVRGQSNNIKITHKAGHSTINFQTSHKQQKLSCKICGKQNHNEKSCFYRIKNERKSSYYDYSQEHLN